MLQVMRLRLKSWDLITLLQARFAATVIRLYIIKPFLKIEPLYDLHGILQANMPPVQNIIYTL